MINLLQLREKEIFEALKKLERFDFVLIGFLRILQRVCLKAKQFWNQ